MLKFERRKLELDIYGEKFSIDFPTVGFFKNYEDKFKQENSYDSMVEFLGHLGLKKEIVDNLEPSHLTQIVSALVESEKKN